MGLADAMTGGVGRRAAWCDIEYANGNSVHAATTASVVRNRCGRVIKGTFPDTPANRLSPSDFRGLP